MFTVEEREALRAELVAFGAADSRIGGVAITGSAAEDRLDRWSDIDLAFGVKSEVEVAPVLADWTSRMYDQFGALHHLDITAGAWIYRVFFLANTLQVDLAFVPQAEFRPLAPTFRLASGTANPAAEIPAAQPEGIIGFAWLYALHVRGCVARGKFWQAEYMISGVRDNALALACLNRGLATVHGRGVDLLPAELLLKFQDALVRGLEAHELSRAFRVNVRLLLDEMLLADAAIAGRLREALLALAD